MMRGEGSDVFRHCFERGADVKKSKPAMEKRRRARINASLAELRSLIPDSVKRDNRRYNKMEKADVLEMAVRYLRHLQETNKDKRVQSTTSYSLGFNECTQEVSEFFRSPSPITARVRSSLLDHLQGCAPHKAPDSPSSSPGKTGPKSRVINDTTLSSTSIIARCLLSSTPLPGKQLSSMETSPPTIVSSTSDVGIFEDNKINAQGVESEENTLQNQGVLGPGRILSSSFSSRSKMAARRDLTDVFAMSESAEAISSVVDLSASENKPENICEINAQTSKSEDSDIKISSKDGCTSINDIKRSNNCITDNKNDTLSRIHDRSSQVGDVKSSFEINENGKEVKDSLKQKIFNKLSGQVDRLYLASNAREINQEHMCDWQHKSMIEAQTCNAENSPTDKAARSEAQTCSVSYQRQGINDTERESCYFQMDVDNDFFSRSCLSKSVSQLPTTSTSPEPVRKFRNDVSASDKNRKYLDESCVKILMQQWVKNKSQFKNSEDILVSGEARNANTLTVTRDSLKQENGADKEEKYENSVNKEEKPERMTDKEEKPLHSISENVSASKIIMKNTGNAPSVLIPIYVQTSFDESENPTVQQAFILTKQNTPAPFIPKTFKPIAPKILSAVSTKSHVPESKRNNSCSETLIKNSTEAGSVFLPQNNYGNTCNEIQMPHPESRLTHSIEKSQDVLSQSHRLVSPQSAEKLNLDFTIAPSFQPLPSTFKDETFLVESIEDQERGRCNRVSSEPRLQKWPLEEEKNPHDFSGNSKKYSKSEDRMRIILQSDDYDSDVPDRSIDANKGNDKDTKERIFLNQLEKSKSTCVGKQQVLTTSRLITSKAYVPGPSLAALGSNRYDLLQDSNDAFRNVNYSDLNLFCNNDPRSPSLEENEGVCKSLKNVPEKSNFLHVSSQPMASKACNSMLQDGERDNILRTALTSDGPIKRENIIAAPKYRKLSAPPQYAQDEIDESFDDVAIRRHRKAKCQEKDWTYKNVDFKIEDPVKIVAYHDQGRNRSPLFLSDMTDSSLEDHHSDIVCIERDNRQHSSKLSELHLSVFKKGCQGTTESHQQNETLAEQCLHDVIRSSSCQGSLKTDTSNSESNADVQFVDEFSHPSQAFDDVDAAVKRSQYPWVQTASERNHEVRKSVRYLPYSRNNTDFVSLRKTATVTESETTIDNSWKTFPTKCVYSTRNTFRNCYVRHIFNDQKERSLQEALSPKPLNLSKTSKNEQGQTQPKYGQQLKYLGSASRYLRTTSGNDHQIDVKSQPSILPHCTSMESTDEDDFEKYQSEDSEVSGISTNGSFDHDKIEDFSNTPARLASAERLKSISSCVKNGSKITSPLPNTFEQNVHENCIEKKQRMVCIESKQPNRVYPLRAIDKLSCVWPKSVPLSGIPGNLFEPIGTPPLFPAYKLEQDKPEGEDDVWRPW